MSPRRCVCFSWFAHASVRWDLSRFSFSALVSSSGVLLPLPSCWWVLVVVVVVVAAAAAEAAARRSSLAHVGDFSGHLEPS